MSLLPSDPLSPVADRCLTLAAAGLTARRLGGDPTTVTANLAREGLLDDLRLTKEERRRIASLTGEGFAAREADRARQRGLVILTPESPGYPALLGEIPDPPLVLYVEGSAEWLATPAVAVVGSRNATAYGRSAAQALASQLAVRASPW